MRNRRTKIATRVTIANKIMMTDSVRRNWLIFRFLYCTLETCCFPNLPREADGRHGAGHAICYNEVACQLVHFHLTVYLLIDKDSFDFMPHRIYFGDNLPILKTLPSGLVDLIYIDPPFNTGKTQGRTRIKTVRDENGDRKGFQGNAYQTVELGTRRYADTFDDYQAFIYPRLEEAYRLLKPEGSLYFHIDYREVHYCKLWLDQIFGRDSFINEIIWAYDYGGKPKSRWPAKHDNILFYARNPEHFTFNVNDIDREPYMAPGLVGAEKAERGKLPTDTWWYSIVGTNSRERNGYPTQKPLGVIDRIIRASSNPGDLVMDFFAGSGTVGESCLKLGRDFILIDNNVEALEVMRKRFAGVEAIEWIHDPLA